MNESFDKAVEFVLQHEGGYSNDPNDPGGETHWGISKRSYPSLDIKNLTKTQAVEIYRKDYWLKNDCDKMSYPLDIFVFNCAVNCGSGLVENILKNTNNVEKFLLLQIKYYHDLVKKNPKLKIYYAGWINRSVTLMQFL